MFYGADYISVTKTDKGEWEVLKPEIYSVITEHYTKGEPLFTDEPPREDTQVNENDSEAVAMIKEIIETRVRPFVAEDGGDVAFIDFDETTG